MAYTRVTSIHILGSMISGLNCHRAPCAIHNLCAKNDTRSGGTGFEPRPYTGLAQQDSTLQVYLQKSN